MTRPCIAAWLSMAMGAAVSLAGCGWWGDQGDDQSADFPDIELSSPVDAAGKQTVTPVGGTTAVPPPNTEGQLALRLAVGQRFPLAKSITQTLTQSLPRGPFTSRSEIDLLMAITVEEVDAGRHRFGVRYQRVRYSHNIAGDKAEYDSSSPVQAAVPQEVLAYQGLINNGFSFWIGADNRIIDVIGFDDFLRRCLRGIPQERQSEFLAQLAITEENQGIANFVDDSIGLLPYDPQKPDGANVRVGETWTRNTQVFHPIPITIATRYTLASLTDREAQIDLLGSITPSTVATYDTATGFASAQRLVIRGGHCVGHCTIDRRTGLPLISRLDRVLDMVVQLADGSQIPQTKSILTTIQAFPEQSATPASVHTDPRVTPAGATQAADAPH